MTLIIKAIPKGERSVARPPREPIWSPLASLGAAAACALLMTAPTPARATPATIQLSTGLDYSSGDYGASQATDAVIVPVGVKVTLGPWAFRALVPFASVKGPADITVLADEGGGEPLDSLAEEQGERGISPNVVRRGLSDVSFAVTRSFDAIGGSPVYVDATVRVRVPTGDRHRGLGVGATDVFLDGEVGGDWAKGGVFVDFGRRFLGDLPDLVRHDGWQVSAGGWYNAGSKIQLGLSYDWRADAIATAPAYQLVGGYVAYRLSHSLRIQVFSGAGLSSSSPNFDVGFTLIYRPTGRRK